MELSEIRQKITYLDTKILSLLDERMELAKQVAEYKKINNLPIFDAERERKILEKIPKLYHEIWTEIMHASKKVQQEIL